MDDSSSTTSDWTLDFIDEDSKKQYDTYFKDYPEQKCVKKSFENDVKKCPYHHPKFRRIVKLEGKYEGLYRYFKSETRIIYRPHGESKTVVTYETSKDTEASYKKQNKKKNLIKKR